MIGRLLIRSAREGRDRRILRCYCMRGRRSSQSSHPRIFSSRSDFLLPPFYFSLWPWATLFEGHPTGSFVAHVSLHAVPCLRIYFLVFWCFHWQYFVIRAYGSKNWATSRSVCLRGVWEVLFIIQPLAPTCTVQTHRITFKSVDMIFFFTLWCVVLLWQQNYTLHCLTL